MNIAKSSISLFLSLLFLNTSFGQQHLSSLSITDRLIDLNSIDPLNKDFEGYDKIAKVLQGVDIVMLGEQSHGEATAYDTKIKLIRYLHEELGFDILAMESGFYDISRAWENIVAGEEVRTQFGSSVFSNWAMINEITPLTDYIQEQMDKGDTLKLMGFDNQISGPIYEKSFLKDLEDYLKKQNIKTTSAAYRAFANRINIVARVISDPIINLKRDYTKKMAIQDTLFINELIYQISSQKKGITSFWIRTLENLKTYISDLKLGTNNRDQQMYRNLAWMVENYPNRKIICWGATSHFLYHSDLVRMDKLSYRLFADRYYKSHRMMGDYVKERYGRKVYTIGFIAFQGKYGLNYVSELSAPPKNSLEYLIGGIDSDNCFLPLQNVDISGYWSRPLGNKYMKNNISEVMDGVIFNRQMDYPTYDHQFMLKIYPKNRYARKMVAKENERP